MKIIGFDHCDRDAWDALVQASPDAWLMHRADWIEIEARFFTSANLSFAIADRDRLVACLPLYVSDAASSTAGDILVHSGIHRHAGLALAPDIDGPTSRQIQTAALRHVEHLAALAEADRIHMSQSTLAPRFRAAQRAELPFWVTEFGYQLGVSFASFGMAAVPGLSTVAADQQVDLDAPDDVLFERLDPACRRAVRKAQRSALSFSCSYGEGELDQYYALARRSSERTGEALPPIDYYRDVLLRLGPQSRAGVALAHHQGQPVAGLLFLGDRGAASYLAGVSEPTALEVRPNDFIHWSFMLWAKKQGFDLYRLGPNFPEVPQDWSIARVSQFKTKFGGRSVPMIQGSLYRNPDRYLEGLQARVDGLRQIGLARASEANAVPPAVELLAHQLSLVGVEAGTTTGAGQVCLAERPGPVHGPAIRRELAAGKIIVAMLPDRAALAGFGLEASVLEAPAGLKAVAGQGTAWQRLRSFHPAVHFEGPGLVPVVTDADGRMAWAFRPDASGSGLLLVGTDLAADLVLLRQGRPEAARNRPTEAQWGYAGERPNYLFADLLDAADPFDRPADWWLWTLRDALVRHAGIAARDVLPGGAAGMIIVTGDDDQAPLEDYRAQRELLGDLPVTYFLHPLAKLSASEMAELSEARTVEWELHPDALETPGEYPQRLAEQVAWFEGLVGSKPRLVRNHGFLNDGYWGHASAWLGNGIAGSSNIPGMDGQVVNGSLLPARLVLDGRLTPHWSVLTAFGDGAMFVHDWDAPTALEAIRAAGRRIVESGVPGVLVFNLHPANHVRAAPMHQAVRELVENGFVAATLGEALAWFAEGAQPSCCARSGSKVRQAEVEGEPENVRAEETRPQPAPARPRSALRALIGRIGGAERWSRLR